MNSAEDKRRPWLPAAHVMMVTFFYGAAIYTYMFPISYHNPEKDMVVSLFYTILTPVLSPLIYSFRNEDVPGALRTMLKVGPVFQEQ